MAIVFGLKKDKQWKELEDLLHEGLEKFIGLQLSEIETIKNEDLLNTLEARGLSSEQFKILGNFLYEKGMNCTELQKHEEARNALMKALLVYEHVQHDALESDFSLEIHYRSKALKQLLDQ